MNITGNEPAMPSYAIYNEEGELVNIYQSGCTTGRTYGLTKREQFAMAAMQSIAGNYSSGTGLTDLGLISITTEAVLIADALIAELNKTTPTHAA